MLLSLLLQSAFAEAEQSCNIEEASAEIVRNAVMMRLKPFMHW